MTVCLIPDEQAEILGLWRKGFDTYDIAKHLELPESEVANQLMRLRDQYRQMTGGGNK